MSHLKEREEKICLNCGTALTDRFCQHCGQENVEPKESAWHLIEHFMADLLHFDGKFFSTMKLLATKPGFLTEEYVKGRRAKYVNPIRMYLFVSAIFFLLLMSFLMPHDGPDVTVDKKHVKDSVSTAKMKAGLMDIADSFDDSVAVTKAGADSNVLYESSGENLQIRSNESIGKWPETLHAYDSMQKLLPEAKRDGAVKYYIKSRAVAAQEYQKKHPGEMKDKIQGNFFHSLPYMLFLSLPLIALLLKLLYIRRKEFYYVSHAIFTVNYYIFFFISLLLILVIDRFGKPGEYIAVVLQIGWFVYLYLAMRRFYKQGWFKTFIKFFLFAFFGTGIISLLAAVAAVNSFLNVGAVH